MIRATVERPNNTTASAPGRPGAARAVSGGRSGRVPCQADQQLSARRHRQRLDRRGERQERSELLASGQVPHSHRLIVAAGDSDRAAVHHHRSYRRHCTHRPGVGGDGVPELGGRPVAGGPVHPRRSSGSPSTSTAVIRAANPRSPYRAASNASNCRHTPAPAFRCRCVEARYTTAASTSSRPAAPSSAARAYPGSAFTSHPGSANRPPTTTPSLPAPPPWKPSFVIDTVTACTPQASAGTGVGYFYARPRSRAWPNPAPSQPTPSHGDRTTAAVDSPAGGTFLLLPVARAAHPIRHYGVCSGAVNGAEKKANSPSKPPDRPRTAWTAVTSRYK